MEPHTVLKVKKKLKENKYTRKVESAGGEHVEGEMYTDLREIWDVTLIYSNLLSSK